MATWGAYFASYVKKTDPAPSGAVNEEHGKDREKSAVASSAPVVTKVTPVALPLSTTKTAISTSLAATERFKRSNSAAKKLYEIPTELPKDPNQMQRSTSNTAREAKLFGYSGATAAFAAKAEAKRKLGDGVEAVKAMEAKEEEKKFETIAGLPPDLIASATIVAPVEEKEVKFEGLGRKVKLLKTKSETPDLIANQTRNFKSLDDVFDEEIPLATKPGVTPNPRGESASSLPKRRQGQYSKRNDSLDMLEFFANQADTATANAVQEPPKKANTLDMLDFFASQANAAMVTPLQEPPKKANPLDTFDFFESQADTASIATPVQELSKKANLFDMLDFFASQAENTSHAQEPKEVKLTVQRTRFESGKRLSSSPRKNKRSLELLDFFANQAMSTISEDKPLTQVAVRKIEPPPTVTKKERVIVRPAFEQPVISRNVEESPAPLILAKTQEATLLPAPKKAKPSTLFPGSIKAFTLPKKQDVAPVPTLAPEPLLPLPVQAQIAIEPPLPQNDTKSFTLPKKQDVVSMPTLTAAPQPASKRISSIRSSFSVTKSSTFSPRTSVPRSSATSFELRSMTDIRENEITKAAIDFRERFITYQKQAEQTRLEKEGVELERERMANELAEIQKQADRIAEAEAAMKKFIESLEVERERDMANEERKRRGREARGEVERRERIAREKAKMIIQEEEERERGERERGLEKRMREQEARFEAERAVREEQEKKQAEIEDAKRRKMEAKLEQERLAKEEAERLTAEMLKIAQEVEEDRLRFEEEEEEEERLRLEEEKAAREEELRLEKEAREEQRRTRDNIAEKKRRKSEQRKEEEEEEELGRKRLEDEQRAQRKRRAARERAEHQRYEEQAAEEDARYTEQKRRAAGEEERHIAAEEDRRGRQPRRNDFIPEPVEESEEEESEDEIVKAERKIQEAFARLAKERGQQAPAPIKRVNTTPIKPQRGPSNQGVGSRAQREEVDRGFARNNGFGLRPQRRPEIAPVSRADTTSGRPQIRGGLPSGPRRKVAII